VEPDGPCRATQVRLGPGDTVVMYSDGVTDAEDVRGRAFRLKGMQAVLGAGRMTPKAAGEKLIEAVRRHSAGCPQHDDITLACFGRAARA
jgi:serine phosphatase RsbU (regulator of sigma subunit)